MSDHARRQRRLSTQILVQRWLNSDELQAPSSWTLGRYEVLRPLGRGATSEVLLAEDPLMGRRVAIKVWRSDVALNAQRFEREIRVLASLEHPQIVRIHDAGVTEEGRHYFVMEYVGDATLEDAQLPLPEALEVLVTVARACHWAHERGVVHRDLKPANVLLGDTPKVADFGVAKLLEGSHHESISSRGLVGTPQFMAPEQISGEPVTPATDVYGLGAMLYEQLTGDTPFGDSESFAMLATRILRQEPDPPSAVNPDAPAGLDAVALRALAKAPGDRFASAAEFADAVQGWLDPRGAPAAEPATANGLPAWLLAVAGVLGLALLAAVVGLALRGSSPEPDGVAEQEAPASGGPTTDPGLSTDPPQEDPPQEDPPQEDPPTEDPPQEDPPQEDPPQEDPPAEDPPAEDPPAEDPATEGPAPVEEPEDPPRSDADALSPSRLRGAVFDSLERHALAFPVARGALRDRLLAESGPEAELLLALLDARPRSAAFELGEGLDPELRELAAGWFALIRLDTAGAEAAFGRLGASSPFAARAKLGQALAALAAARARATPQTAQALTRRALEAVRSGASANACHAFSAAWRWLAVTTGLKAPTVVRGAPPALAQVLREACDELERLAGEHADDPALAAAWGDALALRWVRLSRNSADEAQAEAQLTRALELGGALEPVSVQLSLASLYLLRAKLGVRSALPAARSALEVARREAPGHPELVPLTRVLRGLE